MSMLQYLVPIYEGRKGSASAEAEASMAFAVAIARTFAQPGAEPPQKESIKGTLGAVRAAVDVKAIKNTRGLKVVVTGPGTGPDKLSTKHDTVAVVVAAARGIVLNGIMFEAGTTGYIINKRGRATLTPADLGLVGRPLTLTQLVDDAQAALTDAGLQDIGKMFKDMIDASNNNQVPWVDGAPNFSKRVEPAKPGQPVRIEPKRSYHVELRDSGKDVRKLDADTYAKVGTQLGESLGAAFILNKFRCTTVEFPIGPINKLVDYVIDGDFKFSAKFEKGATPTADSVAIYLRGRRGRKSPGQERLLSVIEAQSQISNDTSWILAGAYAESPAAKAVMGRAKSAPTPEQLNNRFLNDKGKGPRTASALFAKAVEIVGGNTGNAKAERIGDALEWMIGRGAWYKVVCYMVGRDLIQYMNTNAELMGALNSSLQQMNINQLFLDMNIASNIAMFTLRTFAELQFRFHTKMTAKEPSSSRITFEYLEESVNREKR